MDTVSMLNKMSFYCQPILPLVYDESMSYYETLCKVVGQLNTTGETVNKLNEGLTGEIADRQAADAELDARIKEIEKVNKKIHFLVFAGTPAHGAGLIGTAPTRSELRQWVNNHDLIITLLETTNGERNVERNVVYAASCTYNAENWSDGFNIIVPISTSYDSEGDYAVRQKIAKITIPPASASSLDEEWGLQFIEINTPSTSANGVVNFAANIFEDGHMECNLTPFEFAQLYAPTWANRNLCVAVNAKLFYDGYTRTSSIATINSTNHLIRIAFERDYGTFINNGVKQLNKTLDYIIGDVSHNTWTHESIDSKVFDFPRYIGFQFTRGAHNVITTDDESTPTAVYTQYHANESGKFYQNLPVRLIDTVDNAEYWNGVFDIKDGNHMTFTFVASNYATASDKMLVRVIELSANVNTTAWKYAEKEFELPISASGEKEDFVVNITFNTAATPSIIDDRKTAVFSAATDKSFAEISSAVAAGKNVYGVWDGNKWPLYKSTSTEHDFRGSVQLDRVFGSVGFAIANCIVMQNVCTVEASAGDLPAPALDGSDNGKVPTVNGTRWEMKKAVVDDALSDTSINPVQNKAVKAALDGKASTEVASQTANGLMSAKDKKKLDGIADGANKTIVDEMLSDSSTNPVQNKAVTAALATVVRETIYPIAVTATSADWTVTNGIAYKEASADRTFDNIKAAYNGNKTLVCEFERMTYSLILTSTTAFIFASYRGAVANDSQYSGLGKYPTSLITITTTGVGISRTAGDLPAVDGTDNGKMLIVSGGEWALQSVAGTTVDAELSTTSENPVQNKTVTAALNSKLPKTGGTVTGALRTNGSFSAGGTIAFGEAPIGLSQTADGAAEIRYGNADVDDNPPPLSRLKVARPTADDDAATKAYVDGKAVAPILTSPVMIRKEGATDSAGVYLSTVGIGEKSAEIMLEDVNENSPVAIANLRTPTGAGTDNYAATKGYVDSKVASGGSADAVLYTPQTLTDAQKKQARENIDAASDFVVNGTVSGDGAVTIDKTYAQVKESIDAGKSPVARILHPRHGLLHLSLISTKEDKFMVFGANLLSDSGPLTCTLSVNMYQEPHFLAITTPILNSNGDMVQTFMASDPTEAMQIATKKYVDDHLSGAPITIKLGTGNAATSTATFAEIKAALEAGKAPILDSAPGTNHWFALNWMIVGSDSLTIQYGTFNVGGGRMANFTFYDVSVSSTGITYSSRQFTTE